MCYLLHCTEDHTPLLQLAPDPGLFITMCSLIAHKVSNTSVVSKGDFLLLIRQVFAAIMFKLVHALI